ncbi:MAG TPA: RNA polymerase sigma factor [bacterium]|nr:RNA polymerase sigma factor [bacterium]
MNADQDLIRRSLAGEAAAFSELYYRYLDKIYRFVFFKTMHKETAEDLTSQIFIKVYEKLNTFDLTQSFQPWIYQVARNTVIDFYRARHEHANLDDCWGLPGADEKQQQEQRWDLGRVKEYLEKLSAEQREIVLLRLWEGLSYQEIADLLGKSEAACKMSFSRAIAKIRAEVLISLLFILFTNLK